MFGWFKKDPAAALEKKISKKYEESVQLQRSGKIEEYGKIMLEIEQLQDELLQMREASAKT
jgi:hypothetical protein|tara:strand:+ start:165 stop:347 length:183 start_codon:yes stop_codon:yes gene_type:complete